MLLPAFEPNQAGSRGAALVSLGAGEPLSKHGGGKNADLVGAGRQFRERDALFEPLDALNVGDLLAVDLDEHLGERVVLGITELDLQRALADAGFGVGQENGVPA